MSIAVGYGRTCITPEESVPMAGYGIPASACPPISGMPCDHADDHRVEEARSVRECWMEKYDYAYYKKFANEHGMNSVYHASGIFMRATSPEYAGMTLDVLSVGDLSFVCALFEMYSNCGSHIKDDSSYAMTFIMTSWNTLHGYLVEENAFDIGCYEVDFRRYPRGTAEKVADIFVTMLEEMKEA